MRPKQRNRRPKPVSPILLSSVTRAMTELCRVEEFRDYASVAPSDELARRLVKRVPPLFPGMSQDAQTVAAAVEEFRRLNKMQLTTDDPSQGRYSRSPSVSVASSPRGSNYMNNKLSKQLYLKTTELCEEGSTNETGVFLKPKIQTGNSTMRVEIDEEGGECGEAGTSTETPPRGTPPGGKDVSDVAEILTVSDDEKSGNGPNLPFERLDRRGHTVSPNSEVARQGTSMSPARKKRLLESSLTSDLKKVRGSSDGVDPVSPENLKVSFDDLGGIDEVITNAKKNIIRPLVHPEIYAHIGVQTPTGILLHGPPGSGKTQLALAIGAEAGVPFFVRNATEIVTGVSGDSEAGLRRLFEEAKARQPSIVFIDEIDCIAGKRDGAGKEMEKRIVAQLGASLDNLNRESVLVLAATNRPESIDPMLRRCGRFDSEIGLGIPNSSARHKILQSITQKGKLAVDVDFSQLALKTPGFLGADLVTLWAEAGKAAVNKFFDIPTNDAAKTGCFSAEDMQDLHVTMDDFTAALTRVQPSAMREGFETIPDVTWANVGALGAEKKELQDRICFPVRERPLYDKLGLEVPAGILLYGPPGCGKTLLAKAVANQSGANFISVKGPELLNKYVGESEKAVRQLFQRARWSAPCVIFFDEIDSLCPIRGQGAGSQVTDRVVNQVLTELDGVNERKEVYVIAATNRKDIIDPAILRSGRLERHVCVPPPDTAGRSEILKCHLQDTFSIMDCAGISALADVTAGYTGADLGALVRNAKMEALERYRRLRDTGASGEELDASLVVTPEDLWAAKESTPRSLAQ